MARLPAVNSRVRNPRRGWRLGGDACRCMPCPPPLPSWGGDLASRPRLTGDWGEVRDDMAQKGVTLDLDLYWMPQTILSGGKDEASASWGNAIAALKVDTGKAGLWPGAHRPHYARLDAALGLRRWSRLAGLAAELGRARHRTRPQASNPRRTWRLRDHRLPGRITTRLTEKGVCTSYAHENETYRRAACGPVVCLHR